MRSTERKTYGRTASGRQITDDLVESIVRKAEAGCEIEEMSDRGGRLRLLAKRLHRADEPDRPIAAGRVSRSVGSEPLEPTGDPRALSRALDEIRGDR